MSHKEVLFEFRDVDFSFGGQAVFTKLSFTLDYGEYLVISGPARSGKSTLTQMIAGLIKPQDGVFLVSNEAVEEIIASPRSLRRYRRRLGGVGGIYQLLSDRTVMENICLAAEIAGCSTAQARRQALSAGTKYHLSHIANHYPDMISEGEKRAAQIARAEAARKEIILADSPTDGLDAKSARFINERLTAYHTAGATILYLTSGPGPQSGPQRYLQFQDGRVVATNE